MTEATWGVDLTHDALPRLTIEPPVIWPYVTGTPDIRWTEADRARFPSAQQYRLDQELGSSGPQDAEEFDVEALAWRPDQVLGLVEARRRIRWSTRIYASRLTYAMVSGLLMAAGIHHSVFYRIADWSLSEAEARAQLGGQVYAIQWASPSSNPLTVIPGTTDTLAAVNADLNVIRLASTGWQGP